MLNECPIIEWNNWVLSSRAVWSWWRIPRVWREFSTGDVCFQLYWAGCWLSSPSGFIKTCRKNTNNKSTQFIRASKFRCEVTSISDPPKESKRSCRNSNLQFAGTGWIKRLKHLNKHSTLHSLKLKVAWMKGMKTNYEGQCWRDYTSRHTWLQRSGARRTSLLFVRMLLLLPRRLPSDWMILIYKRSLLSITMFTIRLHKFIITRPLFLSGNVVVVVCGFQE